MTFLLTCLLCHCRLQQLLRVLRVCVNGGHAADRTVTVRQVAPRRRERCWWTPRRLYKDESGSTSDSSPSTSPNSTSTRSRDDLGGHTLRASGFASPGGGWGVCHKLSTPPPLFLLVDETQPQTPMPPISPTLCLVHSDDSGWGLSSVRGFPSP